MAQKTRIGYQSCTYSGSFLLGPACNDCLRPHKRQGLSCLVSNASIPACYNCNLSREINSWVGELGTHGLLAKGRFSFCQYDYVKVKVLRCSVCQQPRSQNNGRFDLWSGNETIHLLAHARVRDQVVAANSLFLECGSMYS